MIKFLEDGLTDEDKDDLQVLITSNNATDSDQVL